MTKEKKQVVFFIIILLVAINCVLYFGNKKSGFHEDEYYSYYSTNYVQGWVMPDGEWTPKNRYFQEFVVLEGQEFQYGLVKTVQSWDVHPPMYYWILHTVCSFFPGVFSKWLGLSVNMIAYIIALVFFYLIARRLIGENKQSHIVLIATACYALSPAMISSVMFIRMYTVLSCLILISVYLHIKAWQEKKMTHPFFLLLMAMFVYLGFMTQYYFMIYQFFLTFAICMVLLVETKSLKKPFVYGISAVIPLIFAYFTYPACLGQMFKGQRGAQATSSFFDISNTWERLKVFADLTNDYLFQGTLPFFALMIVLTWCYLVWEQSKKSEKNTLVSEEFILTGIMLFTVVGYLLAVSKTALLLGDSSVRYILPIFGLLFIVIIRICLNIQERIEGKKYISRFVLVMLAIILLGNGYSIMRSDVLFLFPEGSQKVEYAKEHVDIPVIYIYSSANSWCIWESSNELFEYPEVFFVSDSTETPIEDIKVQEGKELLVYIHTLGDTSKQLERVLESNRYVTEYEVINENKFCNLYHFY